MKVGSLVKNTWFDTLHVVIEIDEREGSQRLITLMNGEEWYESELEVIRESW